MSEENGKRQNPSLQQAKARNLIYNVAQQAHPTLGRAPNTGKRYGKNDDPGKEQCEVDGIIRVEPANNVASELDQATHQGPFPPRTVGIVSQAGQHRKRHCGTIEFAPASPG